MPISRVAILWLAVSTMAAAACARPPLLWDDPDVRAAQAACEGSPAIDHFSCVEQQAVASLNPQVCRLLDIAVDDACLQSVYEAANDPSICDRLYLSGSVPTCKAYYAGRKYVPPPGPGGFFPQPVSSVPA